MAGEEAGSEDPAGTEPGVQDLKVRLNRQSPEELDQSQATKRIPGFEDPAQPEEPPVDPDDPGNLSRPGAGAWADRSRGTRRTRPEGPVEPQSREAGLRVRQKGYTGF